ncbi:MAG: HNH endonuclease [Kiritimatiellae bacterium]|nr:HNH endonuclease [Kiritimatiellia bacterium]
MEGWIDIRPDAAHVKRERERARALRNSPWWKERLSRGVCEYCGRNVGPAGLTMDHVVPVARGGRSVKSNCVPCCKECNNRKKAYTPAERILESLFPEGGAAAAPGGAG